MQYSVNAENKSLTTSAVGFMINCKESLRRGAFCCTVVLVLTGCVLLTTVLLLLLLGEGPCSARARLARRGNFT